VNVIAMAAGSYHAIAITADKTCWTWGDNYYQQLGRSLTNSSSFDPQPTPVAGLSNVVAIAAGGGDSYAVTSNGWLYGWGENGAGELGISGGGAYPTPTQVSGISNVVLVTAGVAHAMAMTLQGGTNQYYGWGANDYGQVGNGTNSNSGNNEQDTPAQLQFCTRCQRCVQLGTGGVFTAQCNGTLYLYFNTDNFGACTGQYNVTFGGLPTNVPANADCGIPVGPVTVGNVYTYTASGYCADPNLDFVDANGINLATGHLMDCSDFSLINITNAVCPMWQCFSLVGRIQ
jgi:hypothetical protein